MAYTVDPTNGDIVISGFNQGIGASPYAGLTDMKSVGIESIAGEASVAFSTKKISSPNVGTVSVTSSGSNLIHFSGATGLEDGMAIVFSQSSIANVTVGNVYYTKNVSGSPPTATNLYTDIGLTNQLSISANGTGTFSVFHMTNPRYFVSDSAPHYFLVDDSGNVWTNYYTTTSGYWTFAGNGTATNGLSSGSHHTDDSLGNGLVIYNSVNAGSITSYLFVFSGSSIDYLPIQATFTWHYGWNPATGTQNNNSPYLIAPNGFDGSHQAIVGPDGNMFFCDLYDVSKIQTTMTNGQPNQFNPLDTTTFTYTQYPLLPLTDQAQCIAPLGTNYLIGGLYNVVYTWNSTSSLISYPILLSENNVRALVTVNTNTYIFVGNRGRIWITNGSQAQPFQKIPDHISNSVDPLFNFGTVTGYISQCAVYNWNQLYFGVQAYSNGTGTKISGYGGVWAIDLTTGALRNVGEMSYGTYAGNVSALYPLQTNSSTPGYGLLMGWNDGTNGGADQSINTPYTGGQSWITSDLIPLGTILDPETPSQIEFKLSRPLVAGESVQLYVGNYLDMTYASFQSCGTFSTTNMTSPYISGITTDMPLDKFQWIAVQAVLTSTASSPSYCRITEMRIKNATPKITSYRAVQ